MLMKEISFRALLLTSSRSKTPLNAFTSCSHPRVVSTSRHTRHMRTAKTKTHKSSMLITSAQRQQQCFLLKNWIILCEHYSKTCPPTNAAFKWHSNIPSLCAMLEFLCDSVYSPSSVLFYFFYFFGYSLGSPRLSRKNLTLTYAECVSLSARLFRVTCIKPSGEKKQDSFYFKLVFKLQRAWVSVTVWHNSGQIFFWNWIQQGEELELAYLNGRQMLLLFVDKDKYLSRALGFFFSNNRETQNFCWLRHSQQTERSGQKYNTEYTTGEYALVQKHLIVNDFKLYHFSIVLLFLSLTVECVMYCTPNILGRLFKKYRYENRTSIQVRSLTHVSHPDLWNKTECIPDFQ